MKKKSMMTPCTTLSQETITPDPLLGSTHARLRHAIEIAIEQRLDTLILMEDPPPYLALFIDLPGLGPLHPTPGMVVPMEMLLVTIRATDEDDYTFLVQEACREYGGGELIPIRAEGQWTSALISGMRH